jgi:cytochrome P450 monooxygenase
MFQTKWTAPGAAEGVHKIPIPLLAKALTWQRNRSSAAGDPYFREFVAEFLHAWEAETQITNEGRNTLAKRNVMISGGTNIHGLEPFEFCCFETGTRIVAHLTAKSLVGYPLCRDPELINLFAGYGNAVPSSGFFISMFPSILKP